MKQKAKPESKIPTTGTNTNQKKKAGKKPGLDLGGSLLKLNEFTLIILGALVVTVLVFFLFFRSPDPGPAGNKTGGAVKQEPIAGGDFGLEKRIAQLEVALARIASSPEPGNPDSPDSKGLAALDQRITRLEAASTLKLDGLMARLAKLEKKVAGIASPVAAAPSAPVKVSTPVAAVAQKAPIKKKTVQSNKKANLFHTVKKGETLWSISQKYKTSVTAIRKLNNMTAKDPLYPGSNILVRQK